MRLKKTTKNTKRQFRTLRRKSIGKIFKKLLNSIRKRLKLQNKGKKHTLKTLLPKLKFVRVNSQLLRLFNPQSVLYTEGRLEER